MARFGNALTIFEIESIVIDSARAGREPPHWQAKGAECSRERHRYSGSSYAFTIDVLHVRYARAGRTAWSLVVVTELWRSAGETDVDMRGAKWMKLISGKSADVTAWIRTCRESRAA
jgi:hypothetical protein